MFFLYQVMDEGKIYYTDGLLLVPGPWHQWDTIQKAIDFYLTNPRYQALLKNNNSVGWFPLFLRRYRENMGWPIEILNVVALDIS